MNFIKQVIAIGDPVKFAGEKGSIGIVVAVRKGTGDRNLFDVEWHFGKDSKGYLQKGRSYSLFGEEISKIPNELYREYVNLPSLCSKQKEVYQRIVFENYFKY